MNKFFWRNFSFAEVEILSIDPTKFSGYTFGREEQESDDIGDNEGLFIPEHFFKTTNSKNGKLLESLKIFIHLFFLGLKNLL